MSDVDPDNGPEVDNTPGGKGDGDPSGPDEGVFKAITSQEDFDKAVQRRLTRQQNSLEKKYEGFDDFKSKAEQFDQLEAEKGDALEKANRRAEKAERERDDFKSKLDAGDRRELVRDIADELKLPKAFIKRVQGNTEDEIREDIEDLLKGLPSNEKADSKDEDGNKKPPSQQPKQKMTFTQTGDEPDNGLAESADDILKDIPRGGGSR